MLKFGFLLGDSKIQGIFSPAGTEALGDPVVLNVRGGSRDSFHTNCQSAAEFVVFATPNQVSRRAQGDCRKRMLFQDDASWSRWRGLCPDFRKRRAVPVAPPS